MLKISKTLFIFLNALFLTLLNTSAFIFVAKHLESTFLAFALALCYFCLLYILLNICFIKFLTKFLSILFVVSAAFSVYFMSSYGILIDSDMILNVMQTDTKEASELFNASLIFVGIACAVFAYFVFKVKIKKDSISKRILSSCIALVLALAVFLPLTKTYVPFFRNYNIVRMYNTPFYQFYAVYRYYQRFVKEQPDFQNIANDATLQNTQKKLLVLVVGETARAENYSLGTYTNNNTNFYTKQTNAVFFDNFFSCGTSTAISLPCMFSLSKKNDFKTTEYQENVLDVLQKAGVSVSWYGNNSGGCKGVCDRISDTKMLKLPFDESLLEPFKTKLDNLKDQNIIVLHLQGSHGPTYYKRYPNTFKKFLPTCETNELAKCSQESLINTYDNTLLYTDFILAEIINSLQQKTEYKTALLYVSDHGENLGENGIYLHGMPYVFAPKEQTHIPTIFWSNDTQLMQLATEHKSLKLSHDNLFSTILGFFKVSTKEYLIQDDFLNRTLKEKS